MHRKQEQYFCCFGGETLASVLPEGRKKLWAKPQSCPHPPDTPPCLVFSQLQRCCKRGCVTGHSDKGYIFKVCILNAHKLILFRKKSWWKEWSSSLCCVAINCFLLYCIVVALHRHDFVLLYSVSPAEECTETLKHSCCEHKGDSTCNSRGS